MIYEFEVLGPITGKGRPRLNTYTNRVYTPSKTKDYEDLVKQYFILKYPRYVQFEKRIYVEIVAQFKIPKATNKLDTEKMIKGEISPTKKPDIDNIVKIILDALNKLAFKDDNQITKLSVDKIYGKEDKVYIKIAEY
ncbi:MAG: RusA family crossover junction endodeoxyribonuclease [Clostridia bacterium]|nr:RusA family crossover junction endodeoxyribonuclease [Clostridia bacterium]